MRLPILVRMPKLVRIQLLINHPMANHQGCRTSQMHWGMLDDISDKSGLTKREAGDSQDPSTSCTVVFADLMSWRLDTPAWK